MLRGCLKFNRNRACNFSNISGVVVLPIVVINMVLDGNHICSGGDKKFAYAEERCTASFMQWSEVAAKHEN